VLKLGFTTGELPLAFAFLASERRAAVLISVEQGTVLEFLFHISESVNLMPQQTFIGHLVSQFKKATVKPPTQTGNIAAFTTIHPNKTEISHSRALPSQMGKTRGLQMVAAAQKVVDNKRNLASPPVSRPTKAHGGTVGSMLVSNSNYSSSNNNNYNSNSNYSTSSTAAARPAQSSPVSTASTAPVRRFVTQNQLDTTLAAPVLLMDRHVNAQQQKLFGSARRPALTTAAPIDLDDSESEAFVQKPSSDRSLLPLRMMAPRQAAPTMSSLLDDKGGFRNLGNTCYMNAVLQALLSIKAFVERLQSGELKPLVAAFKSRFRGVPQYADLFYEAFLDLHRKIHSGGSASYVSDLRRIKDSMARSNHRFASNAQQDAHEFLNECLTLLETDVENVYHPDRLKQQLDKQERDEQVVRAATSTTSTAGKRVIASSSTSRNDDDTGDNSVNKSNGRKKKKMTTTTKKSSNVGDESDENGGDAASRPSTPPPPPHPCPVRDTFEMQVTHVFTCIECGDVSTVNEVYRDLSIALPEGFEQNEFSLAALLDGFFAPDRFERSCKPPCSSRFVDVTHHISRLPPVLIVQLKRFKFGLDGTYDKLRHMVKTQARLDVAFCCAETLAVPGGKVGGVAIAVPPRARRATPPPPPSPPQNPSPKLSNHSQVSRLTAPVKADDSDGVEVLPATMPADKRRRLHDAHEDDDDSLLETLDDKLKRAQHRKPPPIDIEPSSPVVESHTDKMLREQREHVTRVLKRKGVEVVAGSDIDQLAIEHNVFDELAQSGAVTQSPAVDEPAESRAACTNPVLLWPEPEQRWQAATTYTLHAVTYHHGRRASSGHYVTAVRKAKNKWTLYNDSSVKDENEDDALHSIANKREGYIFFFVHNSQLATTDVDRI
jgi:ubiquitin C-terminal hydrolase